MIIIQTPLRVSLFGGGSDIPAYYEQDGGAVLGFTIDKYIFVSIKNRFDDKLRIGYTQTEMVDSVDEINHELIRESFRVTGLDKGIEITTMGDIPSEGTGLGSSSTVTVGALHSMYAFQNILVSDDSLAKQACEIEINKLKKPIGKQDQYFAAYGGFRFMEFKPDGKVICTKICSPEKTIRMLNERALLFYTGISRKASNILQTQVSDIDNTRGSVSELVKLAIEGRRQLEDGNLSNIGRLLDENWSIKRTLAKGITSPNLDTIYQKAKKAGAVGGKVTGAGGGGFFLLYVEPENQENVRSALSELKELPFRIENDGTKVIFNNKRSNR